MGVGAHVFFVQYRGTGFQPVLAIQNLRRTLQSKMSFSHLPANTGWKPLPLL